LLQIKLQLASTETMTALNHACWTELLQSPQST